MPARLPADRRARRRVLVVDDNEDSRLLYSAYLRHLDVEVTTAADGSEALRLAGERKPDLIVMDLTMPRMDGWTATRLLRANTELRGIPIVAVTGVRRDEAEEATRAAQFDRYILKPCLPQDLAVAVLELLT